MDKNISALILAVSACAGTACAQSADELLADGREAFLDYRFDEASRLYAQAKKKAKRTDEFFADKYDSFHVAHFPPSA